jgi:outer membrane lipoprotein carrier protein
VTRFAPWVCLLAVSAAASASPDLTGILKGVETRYNRARTLQVHFEQTYDAPQRPSRTESGELFLRKPGRMQWRYSHPAGKLFVSDGKYVYLYTPGNNRVERTKVKESDDMRAPLAFLLGKLDFERDFKRFTYHPGDGGSWIAAEPRSGKAPFAKVEFLVGPSYEIRRLIVAEEDGSTMEFHFDREKLNPPLAESLFRFKAPPGAEVVEAAD